MKLTKEEARAIKMLEELDECWPDSLWLFSASGTLHVMRKEEDGTHATLPNSYSMDPDYVVATFHGIDNDGGDW